MSPVLIDTNILIDHLRGKPSSTDFIKSLIKTETKLLCSVITRIELLAGMRKGEEDIINSLLQIFQEVAVDSSIADSAGRYMNLYMKNYSLTPVDAILAATARKLNTPIYTLNIKHFPMEDIHVIAPY